MDKFAIQNNQYVRPYHQFMSFSPFKVAELYYDALSYFGYVSIAMSYIQGDHIAEVGCGDGKILKELATRYPEKMFEGFDLSKESILFARAFGSSTNLSFYDVDFSHGQTVYDTIFCVETLEHISETDTPRFVSSLYNRLNPGGRLVVTVPSTNLKLISKHYRHYDVQIIQESLKQFRCDMCMYADSKRGFWLKKLLANRLFILNNQYVLDHIVSLYKKKYMYAHAHDGAHVVGVFTKV